MKDKILTWSLRIVVIALFILIAVSMVQRAEAQVIEQDQTQAGISATTRPANTGMKQNQKQQQQQAQQADADAYATNYANVGVGVELNPSDITFNSSGNNDTVFVPNNNTESCLRVFGIAVPTKDGAAILGLPWRSSPCDLEASADDAFAQGNVALGWMFKCQMKANKKAMGGYEACVANATDTNALYRELEKLKKQNKTLMEERQIERGECAEAKDRANDRLVECLRK